MRDVMTAFNKLSVFIYLMPTLFFLELTRWALYRRSIRTIIRSRTAIYCTKSESEQLNTNG